MYVFDTYNTDPLLDSVGSGFIVRFIIVYVEFNLPQAQVMKLHFGSFCKGKFLFVV